ncbi:MAG TPA: type I 3-dehydroquinate dehydratase [Casimicrobiaceae bacterium]|nr:type I 3-dehydroquinate dehydratase [Casimicrobiaceae bacterium]
MNVARPITVRGEAIAGGRVPAICTPLVGRTADAILAELATVLRKSPDVIEWRVDHFAGIADTGAVIDVARRIKLQAPRTPLVFTRRSEREGGARTSLADDPPIGLYEAVCAARCIDLVDWEIANGPASMARVRDVARAHDVALIASYHDFRTTPERSVIIATFAEAARDGADVAKVAVMPNDAGDVLTLLDATWEAHRSLAIPLISMAMGPLGALTRIAGAAFGSALTFAVGAASSAPGQLAIDDLRATLDILRREGSGIA